MRTWMYVDGYNFYYAIRREFRENNQGHLCGSLHDRKDEPHRQANWLSAAQTIPGLVPIYGRHQQPEGTKREEKQTDVNIAVELVLDVSCPARNGACPKTI
jgi:hypothetical protein